MAILFGEELTKEFIMKRVGDISQVAGAKQCELTTGKAKGVSIIEVKTGTGFEFTVLPDRGMDISYASYKGIPISFISKTGIVSPNFYEKDGNGFLRNFYAGLVTTCGLTYMGAACVDEGESLGLHGRISNTPAEDVSVYQEWEENDFVIKLRGKVRESRVFGENITLTRQISTKLGQSKLIIEDIVENHGFNEQPLMLLYHCNFGYPIVSADTKLYSDNIKVTARDDASSLGLKEYNRFQAPTHDYSEQVFYLDIKPNENNYAQAALFNPEINDAGLGVYVKYDKSQLPHLIQWKQMGEGDYVVGLEPGTWYPEGRARAKEKGELIYIKPGEIRKFIMEIGVVFNTCGANSKEGIKL